jgi:hypothetical protein
MIVRPMTEDDLPAVIDLQQAGAMAGLAAIFPQDRVGAITVVVVASPRRRWE